MRAQKREISEKYKSFRLQPDSLYDSRLVHTFLNKFIKRGKKASSRRRLFSALAAYRRSARRPQLFFALLRVFFRLRIQFVLVDRRQASQFIPVPFPLRRNKRDIFSLQTLYRAVSNRRERTLAERVQLELNALTFQPRYSTTLRAQNVHLARVFKERLFMDLRWK